MEAGPGRWGDFQQDFMLVDKSSGDGRVEPAPLFDLPKVHVAVGYFGIAASFHWSLRNGEACEIHGRDARRAEERVRLKCEIRIERLRAIAVGPACTWTVQNTRSMPPCG